MIKATIINMLHNLYFEQWILEVYTNYIKQLHNND